MPWGTGDPGEEEGALRCREDRPLPDSSCWGAGAQSPDFSPGNLRLHSQGDGRTGSTYSVPTSWDLRGRACRIFGQTACVAVPSRLDTSLAPIGVAGGLPQVLAQLQPWCLGGWFLLLETPPGLCGQSLDTSKKTQK